MRYFVLLDHNFPWMAITNVFSPDDLCFVSDIMTDCEVILFVFSCLNDGACHLYIDALLMGRRMATVDCPFLAQLFNTECYLYLLSMKLLVYGMMFLHVSTHLSRMLLYTDYVFEKKWTRYLGPPLYQFGKVEKAFSIESDFFPVFMFLSITQVLPNFTVFLPTFT